MSSATKRVEAPLELPTVQDIMFEVYTYANVSDGIHEAEGAKREAKRAAMLEQSNKVRSMVTTFAAARVEELRDTFAAASLARIIDGVRTAPEIARMAYQLADLMLIERSKP